MSKSRHFRSVPPRVMLRGADEVKRGYDAAARRELTGNVQDFCKQSLYCVETYEHARQTFGESQAYCIGWAIGREVPRLDTSVDQTVSLLAQGEVCTQRREAKGC